MFNKLKNVFKYILASTILISAIIPLAINVFSQAHALVENLESGFIYVDSNSNEFICYPLQGTDGVSIGWANQDAQTPTSLNIPSTVSDGIQPYNVRAITTSGFHGCNFEEITIPQTVEEIKPEAFLACTNLLEIQLPYLLTEIDSSCFMDCRNLKKVSYSDESGNATSVNDIITIIKDHAFTSCINLVGFTRPNSLIRVCQSAFQGCTSITSFFFPANPIVIEKFAFADCAKLSLVYLDKTTQNIENYAFSDSNSSLNFYTNATSVFKFNGSDRNWRLKYLASNKTDAYTINTNQSQLLNDYDFPDLIYQINETPAVINAQIYNKYALTKVPERYATIFGYTCYELNSPNLTVDGYITIPDKVKGTDGNIYTVRILNSRCFSNHEELKGVTFNENLVQIKDNAFDGSLNIETFNFDNCKELKEIGSYALGTSSTEVTGENVVCTSLTLPNSLEIIRSSAFRNFTHANYLSFKTNESECSNLKLIDEYAFYRFGYRLTEAEATCDIVLPCSLNDKDARTIKNISSQLAIYKNAFRDAKSLRSVTMETCSHNVPDHINNDESFGSNAFQSCTYLKNFTASETLYKIGSQFFWNDYKLEDIKLHTRRAWLRTKDSDGNPVVKDPWSNAGWTNKNNTWVQYAPEAIIYCQESIGDGINALFHHESQKSKPYNTMSTSDVAEWSAFRGEVSRSFIPLYDNCDWENGAVEKYNYNGGVMSVIKKGTGSSITGTVTRFRGVPSNKTMDLSNVTSYPITAIGDSAFACENESNDLTKVILPNTLEYIGDRAFFQTYNPTNNFDINKHLKIVTYKNNNGTEVLPSNSAYNSQYCILPDTVNYIGNYSFLNNAFRYVKFNQINYLGIAAFSVNPKRQKNTVNTVMNGKIEEFDIVNTSKINYINGAFYYIGDPNKKTLLYHIQKSANTDLVLESGTKAIANYALAGSTITSLTLPSGFYSMYPLSMAGCYSLTEVNGNGLSSIKYLGYVFEDEDDFWTSDIPQQNYTYANFNVSSFGCFRLCLNLETIDMTKAVNLKTLGSYCFSDCKKLKNMTNGETYKFYKTSNGVINNTPIDQRSTEVMDLSNCLKLRNVGRGTFRRCPSLKYVIFPNSTNYDGTRESEMNFVYKDEYDGTSELFEGSDPTAIMIGETAFQAYENNNALNASQHYKTGIFSTKVPYYFANSSSDLDLGHGSLKYWAFKNKEQHEYILFDTLAEARAYFNIIENA